MSKKVPVSSLQDLALDELAQLIVRTVRQKMISQFELSLDFDMAFVIIDVNEYLERNGVTSVIYEDLLRAILSSDKLEASFRFTCLQMLLNESVQTLVTEIFPYTYYERILQVIAAQGHGLRVLNLKGVWVKEENMHYLHQILKHCSHLNTLIAPYIATDELLQWVAALSPKMRVLDVSGETDITDIGVESLAYCQAKEFLTVVDIGSLGEENIDHTDVALLLLNLPNLTTLKSYSFVGKALKYILDEKNPQFRSKLKYLHDTQTSSAILDAVVRSSPDLVNIYLDNPHKGVLHKLQSLKLSVLKVYTFDSAELCPVLDVIGKYLVHLTLIKGLGTMDIGRIIAACPGLLDLDFYMMDMLSYVSDKSFSRLQGLEILSSPIQLWSLKYFICNTQSLKRLAVDSVPFTDEDLHYIVLENDFKYLEDIWFTQAQNLTLASCEILIDRCPELTSLGQLSGWNLSPDDVILLKGKSVFTNLQQVLLQNPHFPEEIHQFDGKNDVLHELFTLKLAPEMARLPAELPICKPEEATRSSNHPCDLPIN